MSEKVIILMWAMVGAYTVTGEIGRAAVSVARRRGKLLGIAINATYAAIVGAALTGLLP